MHLLKTGLPERRQAEVAVVESAVPEGYTGKIGVFEVATDEPAFLVYSLKKVLFTKGDFLKRFVFGEFCAVSFHGSKYLQDRVTENTLGLRKFRFLLFMVFIVTG